MMQAYMESGGEEAEVDFIDAMNQYINYLEQRLTLTEDLSKKRWDYAGILYRHRSPEGPTYDPQEELDALTACDQAAQVLGKLIRETDNDPD